MPGSANIRPLSFDRTPRIGRPLALLLALEIVLLAGGALLPARAMLAFLVLAGAAAGGALVAHRAARPDDRHFLVLLFAGALALRLLVAMAMHISSVLGGDSGLIFPDAMRYDRVGGALAYHIREFGWSEWGLLTQSGYRGYNTYTAIVYYLLGDSVAILKILQTVIGALIIIPTYTMARAIADRSIARNSALLVAIYPSLLFWSGQHLKDALAGLLLAMFVATAVSNYERRRAISVPLMLSFAGIGVFRPYVAFLVAALYVVLLWISPARSIGRGIARFLFSAGAIVAALPLLIANSEFGWLSERDPFQILGTIHALILEPGGAFSETTFTGWGSMLRFLPVGIGHFILTPLPWKAEGIYRFLIPEVILRYALLPFLAAGLLYAWRRYGRRAFLVMAVPMVLTCLYAIVFLGGGPRHHAQIVPYLSIITAIGFAHWRARLLPYAAYVTGLLAGCAAMGLGAPAAAALIVGGAAIPLARGAYLLFRT